MNHPSQLKRDIYRIFTGPIATIQCGKEKDGMKKEKKPAERVVLTRILHPSQLTKGKTLGTTSTRTSAGSLARNLPARLVPLGKSTTVNSGLYSFMRKYGGAGMMGFHRDLHGKERAPVVRAVLRKMRPERETKSSRGPKFAMVAIDAARLPPGSILDFNNSNVASSFKKQYGKYHRMYDRHAKEGVVAVNKCRAVLNL